MASIYDEGIITESAKLNIRQYIQPGVNFATFGKSRETSQKNDAWYKKIQIAKQEGDPNFFRWSVNDKYDDNVNGYVDHEEEEEEEEVEEGESVPPPAPFALPDPSHATEPTELPTNKRQCRSPRTRNNLGIDMESGVVKPKDPIRTHSATKRFVPETKGVGNKKQKHAVAVIPKPVNKKAVTKEPLPPLKPDTADAVKSNYNDGGAGGAGGKAGKRSIETEFFERLIAVQEKANAQIVAVQEKATAQIVNAMQATIDAKSDALIRIEKSKEETVVAKTDALDRMEQHTDASMHSIECMLRLITNRGEDDVVVINKPGNAPTGAKK
jgi:hypothetical protein